MSSRSQQIMMRSTVKRGDTLNVRARNGVMMISSNVRRSAMRSVTASSSRCGMYTSPTACKQTHVITRSLSSSEPNKAQRKKQSKSRGGALCMNALQGGGGSGGDDRPKLTRESEPKTYWQSQAEKDGKSPFQDPLVIALIASFTLPFIILGIAIGTGYVG